MFDLKSNLQSRITTPMIQRRLKKEPFVTGRPRMRRGLIPFILILAACAPQYVGPSSGKARFSEYPAGLFASFSASCTGPARTFRASGPNTAECLEFMPPRITAAFILEYTGVPEDLPRLVIRFQAEPDSDSYLVRNDIYVNVPQRTGAARQVPYDDPKLRRQLDLLYIRAGGVPEP
jgi:hypothetical protein